jgi:hypothetical protein
MSASASMASLAKGAAGFSRLAFASSRIDGILFSRAMSSLARAWSKGGGGSRVSVNAVRVWSR